jgi:prephenate dehydrogenase
MSMLEEIVHRVELITNQMVERLDSASYEDLADFIDERDRLLVELQVVQESSDSASYKSSILRILEQDKLLGAKMMLFKEEAQKAIEKFQAAEKYKQVYDKEYTIDSVFFNKKK